FGILHDVERQNESFDPQHVPRAAALVEWLNGDLFSIHEEQLELLSYACRRHADGLTSDDPTVGCCWDSDRLDLPRVGILPDREFMSTPLGRSLARRGHTDVVSTLPDDDSPADTVEREQCRRSDND